MVKRKQNTTIRRPVADFHHSASASWQLQTAKARFSEVFRLALAEGPQFITRNGRDAVVVLPVEQFEALKSRTAEPKSLVDFFKRSPLAGLDLKLEREHDPGRDFEL
jgi:prevent-host-death family protein